MWVRRLRAWSGLIIGLYVIAHFANHSIGIFSLKEMEAARPYFQAPFTNPVILPLFYLSLFVHMALSLTALYRKSTLRMPAWQAAQLVLGIMIWPLIALHVAGTRMVDTFWEIEASYPSVLASIFSGGWPLILQYAALVILVWMHFAIGMHFWLRIKPWYPKALPWLFGMAVLLPVVAVTGFLRAGLELERLAAATPGLMDRIFAPITCSGLPIVERRSEERRAGKEC